MRTAAIVALMLLLAACAAPTALLLPGEEGHPTGALAVLGKNGDEQVLDKPLLQARLAGPRATIRTIGSVPPADQQLIATLPPPSKSFTLYFVEDTTTIVPSSRAVLDQIRAEVAARPGAEVQVTGHTDTLGTEDYNDRLSLQRANEIVEFLVAQGFARDMLSAVGRGERDLAVATGQGVANAQNRRVEVIVR
jgi:outer membrane protein OmpA-like peptidoglycan-associated protein